MWQMVVVVGDKFMSKAGRYLLVVRAIKVSSKGNEKEDEKIEEYSCDQYECDLEDPKGQYKFNASVIENQQTIGQYRFCGTTKK